jgi:hypothetical protein
MLIFKLMNMKKILIVYLFVLGLMSVSCSDYLDVVPDNLATIDDAFSNEQEAFKYLATCYQYMDNDGSTGGHPGFLGGDEVHINPSIFTTSYADNNNLRYRGLVVPNQYYDGQNTSKPVFDRWQRLTEAIRTCHIFIENIESVPSMSTEEKLRWQSEAKFLAAYYLFQLVKYHGPVPIYKEAIPIDAALEGLHRERSTIDECFDYIVEVIDEAIPNLPEAITEKIIEEGRISQVVAKSIKAKILVYAASPLYNGNSEYASMTTSEGTPLFSTTVDEQKWVKANQACDEAIAAAEANSVQLFNSTFYKDMYEIGDTLILNCVLRSSVTAIENPETIWMSNKSSGSYSIQRESLGRLWPSSNANAVFGRYGTTMRVVEEFYSKNGVPIHLDKEWINSGAYQNRYDTVLYTNEKFNGSHKYYIAEGGITAELNMNREPRFYSSFGFDEGYWYGQGNFYNDEMYVFQGLSGETGSPAAYYSSTTGYLAKKLVGIQTTFNETANNLVSQPYNFPIMRLADLYLLKAEAANEVAASSGTPTADVYEYVNKVRTRAGIPTVQEAWDNHSISPDQYKSVSGMRDIIRNERFIELAMEGHRYWDLKRWMLLEEYMNRPQYGWNTKSTNPEDYYSLTYLDAVDFELRDYFVPIKQDYLNKNPLLIQNKGW